MNPGDLPFALLCNILVSTLFSLARKETNREWYRRLIFTSLIITAIYIGIAISNGHR